MSALPNKEFSDAVLKIAGEVKPFQPLAIYDPDGDCIEFFYRQDEFRAERIDDLVTVYYSEDTNEIIGSLIKGVSKFIRDVCEQLPGLRIEVKDGPVRLEHLFLASKWTKANQDQIAVVTYEKLAELAGRADVRTKLASADC